MKNFRPIALALALCVLVPVAAQAKHRMKMPSAPSQKTSVEETRVVRDTQPCCLEWPTVDTDGDGVPDRLDHCPGTPKGCQVDAYGCPWDSDQDGVCDGMDRCPNTPAGSKVNAEGCDATQIAAGHVSREVAPPPSKATEPAPAPAVAPSKPQSEVERKLLETGSIRLENIYFETNRANLLPESETSLNEAGDALEKFPDLDIEVQGHTDTRGAASYNMRLSQARAEAVRKYLLDHFHLNPKNYTAKGYGESQPETKERNDEELMRNRRVILKVTNPDALPHGVKVENKK
jgi:OOP family OmpA-OmpF porin